MNIEFLLSIKKHTDTLIEQTKTRPQETLEFKINKQMQTFPFIQPINLLEKGKWLLAVSSFECTNSVFNITDEIKMFSITIPGQWQTKSDEKTFNEVNKLLELRSLELHVKEFKKICIKIELGDNEYKLSDFDTRKENEILEELKNVKYNVLEDLIYRMQFIYDEIIKILDLEYIPTKRTGYSLKPSFYEVVDLNNTLNYFLPKNVKVSNFIDDNRIKSKLKKIKL